jgi:N6-adenosine-specific RNA methylase IME4
VTAAYRMEAMSKYRTIVADPPWDHSDGTGVNHRDSGRVTGLPYSVMSIEDIAALPVAAMTGRKAHLYLWTTTRFLEPSFQIVRDWGFQPSAVLVWCKPPRGWMVGGTYASNVEFVLFGVRDLGSDRSAILGQWLRERREAAGLRQKDVAAHWPSATGGLTGCVANWELGFNAPKWNQWLTLKRVIGFSDEMDAEVQALNAEKGTLTALGSSDTRWFTWPRSEHSAKPEAFLDLVEQVSPGPYLEMFARRARFGWDYWGDESLGTAEVAA